MNLGFEYIKYQWKAKRRHGVHSPFIYDLTDKCFRKPISNELKEKLSAVMPSSLGQASRIDGITPAGLSVIMIAIKAAEKQGDKTKNRRSNDP